MRVRHLFFCTALYASLGHSLPASAQSTSTLEGDIAAPNAHGAAPMSAPDYDDHAYHVADDDQDAQDASALTALQAPPTDHEQMVGTFGVGLFGVLRLPIFGVPTDCEAGVTCTAPADASLTAPMIGARYWFSEGVGIEGAVAFTVSSAPDKFETRDSADGDSYADFGLGLHAGLPLALAYSQHFTFEVVPLLNLGMTTASFESAADGSTFDMSGFLLAAGATVGGEIHFGFLGIPQLALQGTVGLVIQHVSRSAEDNSRNTWTSRRAGVQTTLGNAPWDIFTGNVAAIYYF